jgi:hypothetical protein
MRLKKNWGSCGLHGCWIKATHILKQSEGLSTEKASSEIPP